MLSSRIWDDLDPCALLGAGDGGLGQGLVSRLRDRTRDERGVEALEFIAIMPLLLMITFVLLQVMVFGHTMIVNADAARLGARSVAAHSGTSCEDFVQYATPGYTRDSACPSSCDGLGPVEATVSLRLPIIQNPWVTIAGPIMTRSRAVFRCEPTGE